MAGAMDQAEQQQVSGLKGKQWRDAAGEVENVGA